jgi:hypothetical protein
LTSTDPISALFSGRREYPASTTHESRYNNGLIAKLMLMWRREGMKEIRAWLPSKHQAGHRSICISGPIK